MWRMVPLRVGEKETGNSRDDAVSAVKPFSFARKSLFSLIFLYGGWFIANRLLFEPSFWYSPVFRVLAGLIVIGGSFLAVHGFLHPYRYTRVVQAFGLFLLLLHLRLMVIDLVRVDGHSMEPTLHDGQIIVVERLSSGLHLPALDFPLSLMPSRSAEPGPPYSRTVPWSIFGLSDDGIAAGDVIVFDYAESRSTSRLFVKRIVAVSGQRYEFRDGLLYIDSRSPKAVDGTPLDAAVAPYPERHQNPVTEPPDRLKDLDSAFLYSAMNGIGVAGIVPVGGLLLLGDHRAASRDSRTIGFVPLEAVQGRMIGQL